MFGKSKIQKILEKYDDDKAVAQIFENLYPIFMNSITSMTEEQLNFCFIEYLEQEVNSGGFDSFFSYSYGDFYYETLVALQKIGAVKFKAVLEKAARVFPDGRVPVEASEREDLIMNSEEIQSTFSELDNEFLSVYQDEDIHTLLLNYVKVNIANFS